MPAAPTTTVTIQGIDIRVPTGPLVLPPEYVRRIMNAQHNPAGWKYPQRDYYTYDEALADDLARCYDFYLGGHELNVAEVTRYGTLYRVGSKGYYFYVGI